MKEIIESIKNKNGNEKFSQKELLWYIVGKIDSLYDKFGCQVDRCNTKYMSQSTFWKSFGMLFTLIGALAYYSIIFR